jgi:hypothetical protein
VDKPSVELDHIVITCRHLQSGIDYIKKIFGIEIPIGGQHHFMGTHNAVMAVGNNVYLEVIAIDPTLPAPPHPRWFGLDNLGSADRSGENPLLTHFVLRTTDIKASLANLDKTEQSLVGKPHPASRGDLKWQITLNPNGIPPLGGCLPALIEWDGQPPVDRMAFPGPVLNKLTLNTAEAKRLKQVFSSLGCGGLINTGLIGIKSGSPAGLKAGFTHAGRSICI